MYVYFVIKDMTGAGWFDGGRLVQYYGGCLCFPIILQ